MSLEELCQLCECLRKGRVAPETWDQVCGEGSATSHPLSGRSWGVSALCMGEASGGKGEAWRGGRAAAVLGCAIGETSLQIGASPDSDG